VAGADWAEREARDYYAVTFSGRASTPTLMLREGDEPGVLLRKETR
jgi:NADH:ubiquinone oxidoreductase subunit C